MAKGKARNGELESVWRERLARHRQSGTTVREFCREAGLKESAFHYWRRELSRRDEQRQSSAPPKRSPRRQARRSHSSPALLPVSIVAGATPQAPVEVSLPSGITLKVSSGCDVATLRMVIEAVENG